MGLWGRFGVGFQNENLIPNIPIIPKIPPVPSQHGNSGDIGDIGDVCSILKSEPRGSDIVPPSPWPIVERLNREYHCGAWPEDDGSGLVIYPDDWLSESERRDALRFARENLPDLLKQLCLEHLPQRVRLAVDG